MTYVIRLIAQGAPFRGPRSVRGEFERGAIAAYKGGAILGYCDELAAIGRASAVHVVARLVRFGARPVITAPISPQEGRRGLPRQADFLCNVVTANEESARGVLPLAQSFLLIILFLHTSSCRYECHLCGPLGFVLYVGEEYTDAEGG